MDDRLMQFRVAVLVVATLIIGAILFVLFGEVPGFGNKTYPLKFKFRTAPGTQVNLPIYKSGVLIGRVTHFDLDEDENVIIDAAINADRKISKSEYVMIKSSLLGEAAIQVTRPDKQKPAQEEYYQPGDLIEGVTFSDPLDVVTSMQGTVSDTVISLKLTSDEIRKLVSTFNERFAENKDKFSSIVDNTEQSIKGLNKTLQSVQDFLGDNELKTKLRESLNEVPEVLKSTKDAINALHSAVGSIEQNVKNLDGLTKPLGQRGESMVANIDSGLARLNNTLGQIEQFSVQLNSRQGSLGSLINNNDLYLQLNEAAGNINELTRRMRPIVEDARILTDKVSRNPGIVIRDAIKPGAGVKYSTPNYEIDSQDSSSYWPQNNRQHGGTLNYNIDDAPEYSARRQVTNNNVGQAQYTQPVPQNQQQQYPSTQYQQPAQQLPQQYQTQPAQTQPQQYQQQNQNPPAQIQPAYQNQQQPVQQNNHLRWNSQR